MFGFDVDSPGDGAADAGREAFGPAGTAVEAEPGRANVEEEVAVFEVAGHGGCAELTVLCAASAPSGAVSCAAFGPAFSAASPVVTGLDAVFVVDAAAVGTEPGTLGIARSGPPSAASPIADFGSEAADPTLDF